MQTNEDVVILKKWVETGFREFETSEGVVQRVALSEQEISALRSIVENLPRFRSLNQKQDSSERPTPEQLASKTRERDEILDHEVNTTDALEALTWLQSPRVTKSFSGGSGDSNAVSTGEAIAMVKELYQMGAIRVTAVHIQGLSDNSPYQDTDTLIIELPAEPVLRKKLFLWKAMFDRKQGWTPTRDQGQRFLKIRWD